MNTINSIIGIEVFNTKTLKVECKSVNLTGFIEWFNLLKDEDIKNLCLSEKGYKRVRKIIKSGRLTKTYDQNVYDFVFAYIQHPTLNLEKLTFSL